jgi:GDP-fucose transporter C1
MAGFALGSLGEAQFSWLGLAYGLVSSIFVALYGIFVKRASPVVDNDSWYSVSASPVNPLLVFPYSSQPSGG